MPRKTALIATFALLLPMLASAQKPTPAHHLLLTVTSTDENDWHMTLANVHNIIAGFAPEDVEIEIVAYGPGILFLKKDADVAADIQKTQSPKVHFIACENAMRAAHVDAADLTPGVTRVPSGMVEVIRKEEAGWSYIKGGR